MNPRVCCDSCGYRYENAQKNIARLVMRHFSMEDIEAADWSIENSTRGLPDCEVRSIRRLFSDGITVSTIADMYCLSQQAAYKICSKKTYRNVSNGGSAGGVAPNTRPRMAAPDGRKKSPRKKTKEKLKLDQVLQILILAKYSDLTRKQIGKMYNVTVENIHYIVNRKTWVSVTENHVEEYLSRMEER